MIREPQENPTFSQNYKPISLLPAMSKVAERVIARRLREKTDELGVLPNEQFGFRESHYMEQHLLGLIEYAAQGLNRKQVIGTVLLDVAKTFGRIWHNGLVYKLNRLGYPIAMVKLLDSYARGRKLRVRVKHKTSTERTTEA